MDEMCCDSQYKYLPVSAVAEILYCPRNFYYRIVEGAKEYNAHLLEGQLQEEKRNNRLAISREEYQQNKSVMVSSERLRLIGVLDAVEEGEDIYPVEYKKGELKESLNDDVQVCAQAMLLEEKLGREILRGYIYYSQSHARRVVVFDRSLRELVENTIKRAYEIIYSGQIPQPLADFRCYGCSLAGRCLPYEVNYLTGADDKTPARPLPSLNLGRVLYVDEPGAYVRKKGERVQVTRDKEVLVDIPLCNLEQLVLAGTVNISAQVIKLLLDRGTEVHFVSRAGKYYGSLQPALTKNSALRIAQHKAYQDMELRLKYAVLFVQGKLANMRTILLRYNRDLKEKQLEEAICRLKSLSKNLYKADSLNSLMGIEGAATREYFRVFNYMIKQHVPFNFQQRSRRPPGDPVNALLSFAYTLLTKDMIASVSIVGYDPYIGFLHRSDYGRPALALDFIEEFRPIVADSVVLTVLNKGMINTDDFEYKMGGCFLNDSGRKKFYRAYEERRHEMISHPLFGYRISYMRVFELQARFFAKVLRGELNEYKPFMVR
ncbi:CRISPR-associated protein Cas1 [Desulfofarcimen acetoxidans DSM 771]|uniref:CRISPR-associated endonuclease Cas1 n=1 Tax=Desulfofarcimen acetoxidans (strain ATCC 49208 / DSM 771 / KCTC 5769 / VKM B-1644 / 5575) TaxID=485916 RepID=C8W2P4_DESAS|nr:CRISPR-associated endonuclease Cas4/Cas1 [Desulfofarcimen acetoxidans]ACV63728.1 CRISPR-associated protein Cas1 [Desulfofarcimen acetoxidans DSM 771]